MAEILQFRPVASRTRKPGRSVHGGGDVILFPGVRYERGGGEADDAKGGDADTGAAQQSTH